MSQLKQEFEISCCKPSGQQTEVTSHWYVQLWIFPVIYLLYSWARQERKTFYSSMDNGTYL